MQIIIDPPTFPPDYTGPCVPELPQQIKYAFEQKKKHGKKSKSHESDINKKVGMCVVVSFACLITSIILWANCKGVCSEKKKSISLIFLGLSSTVTGVEVLVLGAKYLLKC